jgi:hypothetical protein
VFDEETGVFDYEEAGVVGFGGGRGVRDSLLEPEGFGVDGDGGVGDRRDQLGAAEDVNDVDGQWDVFETSVGFFAEDFGFVRIDGDDFVARALQVGSDFVRGTARVGGKTDDGDGFGGAEEVTDGVRKLWNVGRKVEKHESLMNSDEKRINEKRTVDQQKSGTVKQQKKESFAAFDREPTLSAN